MEVLYAVGQIMAGGTSVDIAFLQLGSGSVAIWKKSCKKCLTLPQPLHLISNKIRKLLHSERIQFHQTCSISVAPGLVGPFNGNIDVVCLLLRELR